MFAGDGAGMLGGKGSHGLLDRPSGRTHRDHPEAITMPTLEFLAAALAGFGTGLALIVAIGAQGVFVLRQGIRGDHVGLVVLVCLGSDVILIASGVAGFGTLLQALPAGVAMAQCGGAAYLFLYALLAARRSLHAGTGLRPDGGQAPVAGAATRKAVLLAVLAVTWLNPHVYLDTVLLLGSLASVHGQLRWGFGAGAFGASIVWFISVGYGAAALRPLFARPRAWQLLDAGTAVVMVLLGMVMLAKAWG